MKKDDPYNDIKTYHKADKIRPDGAVSALCFSQPRAISNRQRWTTDDKAVTCKGCLKKLKKERLKIILGVYNYLEKQAGKFFDSNPALMWWYLGGRDLFIDLHFEIPQSNAKYIPTK